MKTVGGMRKTRYWGKECVGFRFHLTAANPRTKQWKTPEAIGSGAEGCPPELIEPGPALRSDGKMNHLHRLLCQGLRQLGIDGSR